MERDVAAPVPKSDDWHLLRSCLMWGGVRELLGDDLHDRALAALDRLAEPPAAALKPESPCIGWCNDKNCDCVAEGASYTCKRGSYLLADGSRLWVQSTHPYGRIRVTRTVAP